MHLATQIDISTRNLFECETFLVMQADKTRFVGALSLEKKKDLAVYMCVVLLLVLSHYL